MKHLKRMAPGFYYQQESPFSGIHFVKVGRWWRFSRRWATPQADRVMVERQAQAQHYSRWPTLAMAVSASEGNRKS